MKKSIYLLNMLVFVIILSGCSKLAERTNETQESKVTQEPPLEVTQLKQDNFRENQINEEDVIKDAYKIIDSYLVAIDNMSSQVYSGEYMHFIQPYLSTGSTVETFWEENAVYLSGYRGRSEIDNIKIEKYILISIDNNLTQIQINVEEKWTFMNGQEETFANEYVLVKNNNMWLIDRIDMDDLQEFLLNYVGE